MTAEVAIMNAQAIALAADSAVTFGRSESQRSSPVRISANKIFTLSKYHPVGVMIYGSARLIGTPWETVDFLKTDELLFHPDLEEDAMYGHLRDYLTGLSEEALKELGVAFQKRDVTPDEITVIVSAYVSRLHALSTDETNPVHFRSRRTICSWNDSGLSWSWQCQTRSSSRCQIPHRLSSMT